MRLKIIALLTLSTVTLACCGNKGVTSCCGKGKCNIFCCNCNGGCDKSCKPVELPICWAWDGGTICDNPDGSTSMSGGGPKVPKVPPKPNGKLAAEAPIIRVSADAPNVALCGGAMDEKPVDPTNKSEAGPKVSRVTPEGVSEDDNAMHQAVDGHGKGFFTFNEFLKYLGEERTPELEEYFDKYVNLWLLISSYESTNTSS
ncbi:uncharacterized protein LY89DRAFT_240731 [Mollisia scopiformis]|uniref:Uncharacterized protein n=1 Tax=Mollisia scopiformis TaxID=149040 RepID=A0A194WTH0_MOLSC|nr:uncharacterized protein LY89DRAFT_240731 [Mollisia scopiformis]KUJ11261.1 hypothetical protein LY89DRAFT_240731 [Mollisia scopiformis]